MSTESGKIGQCGVNFRGSRLYCLDECSETDSPALNEQTDLPKRSFEELVPFRSCQPGDLSDVFKQRSDVCVQTEVTELCMSKLCFASVSVVCELLYACDVVVVVAAAAIIIAIRYTASTELHLRQY